MALSNLGLLLLLQSLPLATAETVLGAYIFHRHGDRTTKSYTPVSLTALGADQVYNSGSWYRSNYIAENASSQIHNIATTVPVLSQLSVTSPVDNTMQNSAAYFLQGLYPPAGTASAQTLANGSSVENPLGGFQNIPVNAVSTAASSSGSEDSTWLQGSSSCPLAVVSSNDYLKSDVYLDTLSSTQDFYQSLLPVYNGTFSSSTANFKNAYNVYDFVHVSVIHNASDTIPSDDLLTNDTLHQLQTRADQHEWGLAYNESEPIRSIAGAVLAAQIVDALNTTLKAAGSSASAQRLTIQFGVYATFMAFFGLAQAPAASPDFYGIVDYASSIAFELVTNATVSNTSAAVDPADVSVRFLFANGSASAGNAPRAFPLFGQAETVLPWTAFAGNMSAFSVGTTAQWCAACGNTTGVCASSATASGSGGATATAEAAAESDGGVSRPVAGVIGALVTLVVILGLEALIMGVAGLRLIKKSAAGKAANGGSVPAVTQA